MAKTSIFSKDYEKLMRKRKKRLRIFYVLSFLIVVFIFIKIINYDFSNIEHRLQLWVKSESNNVEDTVDIDPIEEINTVEENSKDLIEEKALENTEEKIAFVINNINLNLVIKNQQGNKAIVGIENRPQSYYYSVSNDGKSALIIDNSQNIQLIKINGEIINLTLSQYISPSGEVFEKNNILSMYAGYLWHTNAKILSDSKIAYITNMPYFGYDLNQYVCIIDLQDKSHRTIWNMKGKNVIFGEFNNNRLEVTIDGNIRYINENGEETS